MANSSFALKTQIKLVLDAEQRLCDDLQWAGLQWDEGPHIGGPYGPYKQSERNDIYQEHAAKLLDAGSAYRCFCTPQTTASGAGKSAYVTSGCYQDCASLPPAQAQDRAASKQLFTIRLKPPADARKRVYTDLIYGKIQRLKGSPGAGQGDEAAGIDAADTILVKSDGTPTYHFANVVDDHLMKITHVIRGTEWMASTPLHYDLYTAFGWAPPQFAHVGLLVDEKQAKLSKRSDSGLVLDVKSLREQKGVLPETLCNFLALLGWSNPGRDDVLEMAELVAAFDLKFTKGNTIVRMEKLWYLQKQHVARKCEQARIEGSLEAMASLASQVEREVSQAFGERLSLPPETDLATYCAQILLADSKSYSTPAEYVARNRYFFTFDEASVPPTAEFYDEKHGITGSDVEVLVARLISSGDWDHPDGILPRPETSNHTQAKTASSDIEATSARIHAALTREIWATIFPSSHHGHTTYIPDTQPSTQRPHDLPSTAAPTDLDAHAQDSPPASAHEKQVRYKAWNKAVMRHLREKLSYGLPGPGVGSLMAILGRRECCRRLGATDGQFSLDVKYYDDTPEYECIESARLGGPESAYLEGDYFHLVADSTCHSEPDSITAICLCEHKSSRGLESASGDLGEVMESEGNCTFTTWNHVDCKGKMTGVIEHVNQAEVMGHCLVLDDQTSGFKLECE